MKRCRRPWPKAAPTEPGAGAAGRGGGRIGAHLDGRQGPRDADRHLMAGQRILESAGFLLRDGESGQAWTGWRSGPGWRSGRRAQVAAQRCDLLHSRLGTMGGWCAAAARRCAGAVGSVAWGVCGVWVWLPLTVLSGSWTGCHTGSEGPSWSRSASGAVRTGTSRGKPDSAGSAVAACGALMRVWTPAGPVPSRTDSSRGKGGWRRRHSSRAGSWQAGPHRGSLSPRLPDHNRSVLCHRRLSVCRRSPGGLCHQRSPRGGDESPQVDYQAASGSGGAPSYGQVLECRGLIPAASRAARPGRR